MTLATTNYLHRTALFWILCSSHVLFWIQYFLSAAQKKLVKFQLELHGKYYSAFKTTKGISLYNWVENDIKKVTVRCGDDTLDFTVNRLLVPSLMQTMSMADRNDASVKDIDLFMIWVHYIWLIILVWIRVSFHRWGMGWKQSLQLLNLNCVSLWTGWVQSHSCNSSWLNLSFFGLTDQGSLVPSQRRKRPWKKKGLVKIRRVNVTC